MGPIKIFEFGQSPRCDPLGYPGNRPAGSYVFFGDHIEMLDTKDKDNIEDFCIGNDRLDDLFPDLGKKFMIVGYGSNANPPQLVDKFKNRNNLDDLRIPVLKGKLRNYDIVYSARFSGHGYLPATITGSNKDTEVEAWANILDKSQLDVMDKTEGRCKTYCLAEIPGCFELENGETFSPVYTYVAKSGPLLIKDSLMKLATAHDEGQISKYTQSEILSILFQDIASDCKTLDRFVSMIKIDAKKRGCMSDGLASRRCDKEFKPLPTDTNPMTISDMKKT